MRASQILQFDEGGGVDTEDVRLQIYRSFVDTGRPPTLVELTAQIGLDDVRRALQQLAGARHIVLGADGEVVMAHPFSAVPLGFSAMGRRTLWWGGCAWDSFALPHLLPDEPSVLVATQCPGCARALAWDVTTMAPPAGPEVAHFLTPVSAMWDDVVTTCANQRLYCSEDCVDRWLRERSVPRGYVMDLATLWRLASGWYDGRLTHGYQRRDPADAATYLRSVGLEGPFWGL
ncbi:MAG: hypothetical protein JJD92_00550 [Frankiaceae bacterium]|nr:hypothetical protein [Frankiaceae bacterium]